MNSINLIPQHRIEARRRRVRVRAWAWICAGYASVLVVGCAMAMVMFGSKDRVTSGELARLTRQVTDQSRQLALVQPEMNEAMAQLDASRAVTVQPDWGLLLKLLAHSRGDSVVLDRVALSPVEPPGHQKLDEAKPVAPGNIALASAAKAKANRDTVARKPLHVEIQISGLAKSQLDVSAFVLRLEQQKLFDHVKLLATSRVSSSEASAVTFRLQCSMVEDFGERKP